MSDYMPPTEVVLDGPQRLPETAFSRLIDGWILRLGDLASWLWVILMAIILLNVVMRYALGQGRIEFEELQWHLYAAGFLLAIAYAYVRDTHVRVDLIHARLSLKQQAWIELAGTLLFTLPFISLVFWHALPFVARSWEINEASGAPGGLPWRWVIKAVLPLSLGILGLAVLSRLTRVLACLAGREGRDGAE